MNEMLQEIVGRSNVLSVYAALLKRSRRKTEHMSDEDAALFTRSTRKPNALKRKSALDVKSGREAEHV